MRRKTRNKGDKHIRMRKSKRQREREKRENQTRKGSVNIVLKTKRLPPTAGRDEQ